MSAARTVVLRLVGGRVEGQWWTIPDHFYAPTVYYQGAGVDPTTPSKIDLVATGSVEWDGDRCAEVYVPANRLAEWRAEHQVELPALDAPDSLADVKWLGWG